MSLLVSDHIIFLQNSDFVFKGKKKIRAFWEEIGASVLPQAEILILSTCTIPFPTKSPDLRLQTQMIVLQVD